MITDHLAMFIVAVASGSCLYAGYRVGRWNSRKELDRVHENAWYMGWEHRRTDIEDVSRPGIGLVVDGPLARGDAGPGHLDMVAVEAEVTSEFLTAPLEPGAYIYPELAPEALDAQAVVNQLADDAWDELCETMDALRSGSELSAAHGPGQPDGDWYARQLHHLADWRADWHADVQRFDEEWLPGYVEWYARGLAPGVGLRRILESA
jgi:hypothetical protein